MAMKKWNLKITIFEFIWYIFTGLVALWGLTYVVLGCVANYATNVSDLVDANNTFKNTFGLEFHYWGLIILAIAVIEATIVLCIYAKSSDREYEKQQRRAARLSKLNKTPVVDAEVTTPSEE